MDPGSTSNAVIKFTSCINMKACGRYKTEKIIINPIPKNRAKVFLSFLKTKRDLKLSSSKKNNS